MQPIDFTEKNTVFQPPPGYDESQVFPVYAHCGTIKGGNMDGAKFIVTCWQPDENDILKILHGGPIYLQVIGGLPPHCLMTEFPCQQ